MYLLYLSRLFLKLHIIVCSFPITIIALLLFDFYHKIILFFSGKCCAYSYRVDGKCRGKFIKVNYKNNLTKIWVTSPYVANLKKTKIKENKGFYIFGKNTAVHMIKDIIFYIKTKRITYELLTTLEICPFL